MSGQKQPRIPYGPAPLLNLQLRAIDTVDQASRSMTYTLGSFIDYPATTPMLSTADSPVWSRSLASKLSCVSQFPTQTRRLRQMATHAWNVGVNDMAKALTVVKSAVSVARP